jgi:S-adenosylhomocysteine hydrolase
VFLCEEVTDLLHVRQHSYGRREIEIAEQEMPGIMALRKKAKVYKIQISSSISSAGITN